MVNSKLKKFKFLTAIFIAGFLLLSGAFFLFQEAEAQNAYFRLSPGEGSFCQGQVFEIDVRIGTDNADTNAAEFYIYYDTSMLEVVDVNPSRSGVQIHEGNVYQSYIDNNVDTEKGEIRLTGFSIGSPYNSGSGSGSFARIPFRGLNLGQTEVNFGFTPGSTTDSNIAQTVTSVDILSEASGGSYTIYPDELAPYVQNRRPDKDQRNVPVNTTVNFDIKDDCSGVDINKLRVNVDGIEYSAADPAHFTYAGIPTSYQITIRPVDIFPEDYEVKVKITATDFVGNSMEDNYSFFTGHLLEGPYTLLWDPDRFSTENPPNTDVCFHIKDDREGVDINTVEVLVNGIAYKKSGGNRYDYSGDPFEYTVCVDPEDLLSGVVTVVINGCDLAGHCMPPDSYWFAIQGAEFICPPCPPCPSISEQLLEKIPGLSKVPDKLRKLRENKLVTDLIKKLVEPLLALNVGLSLVPLTISSLPVLFSQLPYLFWRLLYLLLTLLGLRRRGKPWGIVFDSQTKEPIKNAVVRIYDLEFNKLKETQFTDSLGRFGFFVPPGKYYIRVIKPGYIFPSRLSATVYRGASVICYQGGEISRREKEPPAISIYVPLDPETKGVQVSRAFVFKVLHYIQIFLERVNYLLIIFGTAFSLFTYLVIPSTFNEVIFFIYLVILVAKIIITIYSRESFGVVVDKVTKKPVDLAIVRLYKEGQLMQTRVSDTKGRFNFLVLPGDYYLTIGKTGYKPYQSKIIKVRKGKGIIRIRIYLEKGAG